MRGLHVDDELELRGLLNGKTGGLRALENLVHEDGEPSPRVVEIWSIRDETAGLCVFPPSKHARKSFSYCKIGDARPHAGRDNDVDIQPNEFDGKRGQAGSVLCGAVLEADIPSLNIPEVPDALAKCLVDCRRRTNVRPPSPARENLPLQPSLGAASHPRAEPRGSRGRALPPTPRVPSSCRHLVLLPRHGGDLLPAIGPVQLGPRRWSIARVSLHRRREIHRRPAHAQRRTRSSSRARGATSATSHGAVNCHGAIGFGRKGLRCRVSTRDSCVLTANSTSYGARLTRRFRFAIIACSRVGA